MPGASFAIMSAAAPVAPTLEIGVVFPPCSHEYYAPCLLQWLSTTVADRTFQFPTKCAHDACSATLSAVHAESLLTDPAYLDLRDKYSARALELEGRVVTCPQPNCSATIVLPDQSLCDPATADPSILCAACNSIMCVRCDVPDHWPTPCTDVKGKAQSRNDLLMLLLAMENKWPHCPNCQAIVERRDGCNYIKCLCGTGFCFKCGVPYRDNVRTTLHRHGQPGCTCGLFNFRPALAAPLLQPGARGSPPHASSFCPRGA
ncbi:hypothetical protein AMAG_10519 [Allomyces macrogynus ATCC 38327]|uniref:RBR-type E3 ubiquitin transferase n=1 Tax=Allomyces macrogynus (strain ATCC 38327) TaxID=578462 RepID=A0A0L0SUM7_ALLM3|nr:hypothetical protein AMAG_10519 [Allomyces macrogynus ATCC 38327]|eukprot:KNE66293.1 hypothetical protein AMAG_10519 [Allomyces macrogynus ATCC 38327]